MIRARRIYEEMYQDIERYRQSNENISQENNNIRGNNIDFNNIYDNNQNQNNQENVRIYSDNYQQDNIENNNLLIQNDMSHNDSLNIFQNKNSNEKEYNEDGIEIFEFKNNNKIKFNQKECLICLDEFNIGEQLSILKCEHCYHEKCLKDWIKKIKQILCPLCKASQEKN